MDGGGTRGRSVGLVPFLFGVAREPSLAGPVLRRLLGDLGVSADAGRALLARMVRQGLMASDRHGRTTRYRLIGEFARGFERIRDRPQARPTVWPGHFQALLYRVAEQHRDYRDGLRRTAVFAGFGLLQPGVLISTVDRWADLADTLARRPPGTHIWLTRLAMDPDQAAPAAALAWDLSALATTYRGHIQHLSTADPVRADDGPAALRSFADHLIPVLVDTLREPTLPTALLPSDWPGPRLRAAIGELTATHGPAVERYVQSLILSME